MASRRTELIPLTSHLNPTPGRIVYSTRNLITLLVIVASALLVRILFFSGAIWSDDVIYAQNAMDIVAGNWGLSDYVGAQRYGFHLPMALFMSVFGFSQFSANFFQLFFIELRSANYEKLEDLPGGELIQPDESLEYALRLKFVYSSRGGKVD